MLPVRSGGLATGDAEQADGGAEQPDGGGDRNDHRREREGQAAEARGARALREGPLQFELQVAVAVLEKFVDDRAFARADYLEESDLRVPH